MKQFFTVLLAAVLFPYIITLVWTGNSFISEASSDIVKVYKTEPEPVSAAVTPGGRRILLDRGEIHTYVELETYLEGILARQLLYLEEREYQKEAWKAQAIIARTYVYRLMGADMEIAESALDLDYLDEASAKKLWNQDQAAGYFDQIREAVKETKGQVMQLDGDCILPLFHQLSTGRTRTGESIYPYLQSVSCSTDPLAEGYQQTIMIKKDAAAKKISSISDAVAVSASQLPQEIQLISKDEAGYITRIQVGGKEYTGEQLQNALGLPSAAFVIEDAEDELRIITKGSGHGFGLSQNEAWEKAKDGWKAEDILFYFYPGIIFYYE